MTAPRRSTALAILAGLSLLPSGAIAGASSSKRAQAAVSHRIVSLAERELARGVHEIPDGSNNSRSITRYRTATAGAYRGAPWCAYFVSYIAKSAGVPLGYRGEGIGYVPYIRDWAHKTGRWRTTPKPGYLITFPQHVGIVEHVYSNRTLTSIEGNTGNAVRRRYHGWGEAVGYVRLADGGAIEQPTAPHPPVVTVKQKLVPRIRAYPDNRPAVGRQVDFSAQDSSGDITRYDWDLNGDGRWDQHGPSAAYTWQQAGTFAVKLRVTDRSGKTKSTTAKVYVHANQPPHAQLALDSTSIHQGEQIHMDASGSHDDDGRIVRYQWDFTGDGFFAAGSSHASHTYAQPGSYVVRVRVTDDSGNVSEASQPITVAAYAPPVASASCSPTVVTSGQTVRCHSDDSASPYRVQKHEWDINGDGTYDLRGTSVSFSYRTPGNYRVHLRVTDVNGNTAETDAGVRVNSIPPIARIAAPATLRLNTPLTFDGGGSTHSDGTITGYEWDTGAGFQAGGRTTTVSFATPGSHTVRLRVTDDSGMTATSSYTFTLVNQAPVAAIVLPSNPVSGRALSFDGSHSYDPDGTVARYDWDLNGDGVYESTGVAPSFTYSAAGTYTVKLRVTDLLGATATTTAKLTVLASSGLTPLAALVLPGTTAADAFAG